MEPLQATFETRELFVQNWILDRHDQLNIYSPDIINV